MMEERPGSRSDEALFKAALILKYRSINTHLPSDAIIESGAVDLFLAGTTRTLDEGA